MAIDYNQSATWPVLATATISLEEGEGIQPFLILQDSFLDGFRLKAYPVGPPSPLYGVAGALVLITAGAQVHHIFVPAERDILFQVSPDLKPISLEFQPGRFWKRIFYELRGIQEVQT